MTTHPHDARSFRRYAQVSPEGTVLAYTDYADGTAPTDLSTLYVDVTDRPDLWNVPQIPPDVTRVAMRPVPALSDFPVEALPEDASLPTPIAAEDQTTDPTQAPEEPPVEVPVSIPETVTADAPVEAPKKSAKKVTKKKV